MRSPTIEFEECLKDSPKFRDFLEHEETVVDHLEQKLEKTIKLCAAAVESGKEYIKNQSAFATSLTDLQSHFHDERPGRVAAHSALGKIIECVQEMNKFHTTLLDQANRTVLKNLRDYIRTDIREVRECRALFTRVSDNLDGALTRNAQANKNRLTEVTEASNYLAATTSCFRHTALDYVNLLLMLRSKKMPEILWTLMSYYQACSTFHHQGSDLCNDHEPFFKALADDINEMRAESKQLEKTMQNRHLSVGAFIDEQSNSGDTNGPFTQDGGVGGASGAAAATANIHMEGYLFKRTSKGFKTWNRRWFYLCDKRLMYRKRGNGEPPSVMEEDLRICTVRPANDSDRRFCFEVISPAKSHILQADSADMLRTWMMALHCSIGAAIQGGTHDGGSSAGGGFFESGGAAAARVTGSSLKKIAWEQFLLIPGNDRCCDCGHPEPRWASINLGITLCISCSGVHRSLGVHHSKVRSLTLDAWEPEIVKVMVELGNQIVNRVYEACVPVDGMDYVQRATEGCDRSVRETWIRCKYVDKRFVRPLIVVREDLHEMEAPAQMRRTPGDFAAVVSPVARRWSVRRLRRRPNSRSRLDVCDESVNAQARSGKPVMATKATSEDELNAVDEDGKSTRSSTSGGSVVVIGKDLVGPSLKADITLSSDQESTGEDDGVEAAIEEDIANLNPNVLLYKSSAVHNLPVMCQALAAGANKLWRNESDHKRTPLHQAVLSGSIMACEYLLLNGIPIDVSDEKGYTALHLATEKGCTAQAFLLLKHHAKHDAVSKDGKRPIDIAVEQANADIVTLLRLTALNEEIGLQEHGTGEGDTYNDVMKDFSQRLQRSPKNDTTAAAATGSTSNEGS